MSFLSIPTPPQIKSNFTSQEPIVYASDRMISRRRIVDMDIGEDKAMNGNNSAFTSLAPTYSTHIQDRFESEKKVNMVYTDALSVSLYGDNFQTIVRRPI